MTFMSILALWILLGLLGVQMCDFVIRTTAVRVLPALGRRMMAVTCAVAFGICLDEFVTSAFHLGCLR